MVQETANLSKLKAFAAKRLGPDSALRSLILSEPDEMPESQAIERAKVYLKLLDNEFMKHAVSAA